MKLEMTSEPDEGHDTLACPSCESALRHDALPETCAECGFTVEVFPSSKEAAAALSRLAREAEAITTLPRRIVRLGWVVGHTRLLLA